MIQACVEKPAFMASSFYTEIYPKVIVLFNETNKKENLTMKKLMLFVVLLVLPVFYSFNENATPKRIFIERSANGVLTVDNADSRNTKLESDQLVMSVVFNYDAFDDAKYFEYHSENDFDLYIETSRSYHYEINKQYDRLLNIESDDVFISAYTPFVFYYFNDESMYEVYQIALNSIDESFIDSIYLYESSLYNSSSLYEDFDELLLDDEINMEIMSSDPRDIIDYDNFPKGTPYTGAGIKIGILDTGVFNPNHSNFANIHAEITFDTYTGNNGSPSAQHPTWVASVLGGKFGIASGASLYYVDVNSQSGFTAIEKLIDKGVHIINMSIANKSYYNNGSYDSSQEAYLDYIYVSTRVVMIAGTGNSFDVEGSGGYIALPALSSNTIAVGSVNTFGNMSKSSSSNNKNDIRSKPNLVAMGDSRSVAGFGVKSGTSYSTPAVSGAVALFFQRWGIKDMPATLAALTATADNDGVNKNNQTIEVRSYNSSNDTYTYTGQTFTATNYLKSGSGLFQRSGAGQLDIEKFLNYNKPFIIGTLNLTSTDYVPLHSSIYLSSGQTITASLAWQRNASKKTEWIFWTTYTSAPLADLDIAITNSSGTVLLKSSAIYTNTEMIRYTAPSSGYYQLKFKPYSNYQDLKYINYAYTIS